jgi:hypothetical protein
MIRLEEKRYTVSRSNEIVAAGRVVIAFYGGALTNKLLYMRRRFLLA